MGRYRKNSLKIIICISALIFFSLPLSSFAQQENGKILELQNSFLWRGIHDLVVDGDLVYSIYKSGLAIYDMQSGFPAMDTIAIVPLEHEYIYGLKIINELMLYNYDGRLGFVFLENPYYPRIIAETDLGTDFLDLTYRSLNLYLACGFEGVKIFNLGMRENPIFETALTEPAHTVAVWIYENYLYAIDDYNGLFIYDISRDLTQPEFVGKKLFPKQLKDMVSIGSRAYCANTDGGLVVLDMSDPEDPVMIANYETSTFINHVNISGGYVFASDVYGNFEVYHPDTASMLAYVEKKSLVTVPRIITQYNAKTLMAVDTGNIARIYRLSSNWNLEELAAFGKGSPFTGFAIADSTAYIASKNDPLSGLEITPRNQNPISGFYPARANRIKSYDGFLYMADNINKQIWITGISLGFLPQTIGLIPYEGDAVAIDVSQTSQDDLLLALFKNDSVMLYVLDPDSKAIEFQNQIGGFEEISSGMVDGEYLYVADIAGLNVYNISDIMIPEFVDTYDWPGMINHLEISDDLLYTAGDFGFNINELENNLPGEAVKSYQTESDIIHFALDDQIAFCAAGDAGIIALDMSPDSGIALQGIYSTPGYANYAAVLDSSLIVSDSYGILSYYISLSGQFPQPQRNPVPRIFEVGQNFPNPFNQQTVIPVDIPAAGEQMRLEITIYDILGRKVRVLANEIITPGHYFFKWDGLNSNGEEVSTGIYFYRTHLGGSEVSRKMLLLK